jgi:hypothetical protein
MPTIPGAVGDGKFHPAAAPPGRQARKRGKRAKLSKLLFRNVFLLEFIPISLWRKTGKLPEHTGKITL